MLKLCAVPVSMAPSPLSTADASETVAVRSASSSTRIYRAKRDPHQHSRGGEQPAIL